MLPNLIVPVLTRYDLLNRMLATIDYPIRDLVIVDNGGHYQDLFGMPALDSVQSVWVLSMPSNLGVAGSWNLGVKSLPHDDRWFITSNDVWFRPGALETLSTATRGSLSLSNSFPHYHTFAIGEDVVRRVGLFDERLTPAYFEDNDFERRVKMAGLPVAYLDIDCGHDNSSTLNSSENYKARNAVTFESNRLFYERKIQLGDSSWGWDLDRRRANEWQPVD